MTRPEGSTNAYAAAGALATVALYLFFYLPRGDWDYNFGYGYGRDFINFWAAGRLAWLGETQILFDDAAYNAWLKGQFSADIGLYHIYSYPPSLIPLLMPFGALPYGVALAVWTSAHLLAIATALRLIADRPARAPLLVLLAPAVGLSVLQGQMTATLAALLCVALANMHRRPLLAGIMLGMMTVKPQLGIVVGLIVLCERRWRVVAATAATVAALVTASCVIAGPGSWVGYVNETLPIQNQYLAKMTGGFTYFMLSPYAAFRHLSVPANAAMTLHVGLAAVVLVTAVLCWRADSDRTRAMLVVGLASILVTPYANLYDLTLVALPLAMLIGREETRQIRSLVIIPLLWLLPAIGLPAALVIGPLWGAVLALCSIALALSHRVPEAATSPMPAR